jgi:hypothetical protein
MGTIIIFNTLVYFTFISVLIHGFDKIKNFESIDLEPRNKFTIIVPFRNEADLPLFIDSFSKMNYLHWINVILVDDESKKSFKTSFKLELLAASGLQIQKKMRL